MRKLLALTMLAIFAAAAFTPAIAQQGQQQQQEQQAEAEVFRGTLQTVNVEAQTFAVKLSEEAEPITVTVNSETELQGPNGEITLADLSQHQGDNLEVHYVQQEQEIVAVQVRVVA